ncbi:hypothetical protein SAMN05444920_11187 [Nonomuraea solani]|uniref:Uncharacterized protein n=1 Tax=Nonomuraea solani TaxID=1144553 RepID=A0A1H6EM29_9ACTN|nr:hypothetical protein [Nonomuraea solani]SEG97849.1 hypothetical protein SAMN05444920_11187 [Nonomuraea solani]
MTGIKRPLLWLILVVSVVCNAVLNVAGANMFVGAAFGVVALVCAGTLVKQHYQKRRAV